MGQEPLRLVHAADFHLEQPLGGIGHVPDTARERLIEAPYLAAERVFDTALAERADLVVLAGDLVDPRRSGPRGPAFLAEQFARLAEHAIDVYWATGAIDAADRWPACVRLPPNVHVFPAGRPEEFVRTGERTVGVRLVGASRRERRAIRADAFFPSASGLPTIAVANGTVDPANLLPRNIEYWALGGRQQQQTLECGPALAVYPGSPQGRRPAHLGPHGCQLVSIDRQRRVESLPVATDVVRWFRERVEVDAETTFEQLERRLRERTAALAASSPGVDRLVTWVVAGSGPLMSQLRHEQRVARLLDALQREFGTGPDATWSVGLAREHSVESLGHLAEQDTIVGAFLREVGRHLADPDSTLDLRSYLDPRYAAGTLGDRVTLDTPSTRPRLLAEAALLGTDLLDGEETSL